MHYDGNCSATPRQGHDDPRREVAHLAPHQGDLFEQSDAPPTRTELFLEFHSSNPHVYRALRDLARSWLAEGKTKCSITLLYNVARWRLSLRTQGEGMFELNDHHQAFYARALMRFEPELAGMFDLRRAPEADAWIATFGKAAA